MSIKLKHAKDLYYTGNSAEDIAIKLGVREATVTKWIEANKWIQKKELIPSNSDLITSEARKLGVNLDFTQATIQEQIRPILGVLCENIFQRLLLEKQSKEYGSLRDYGSLMVQLQKLLGDITGETAQVTVKEDSVQIATFKFTQDLMKRLEKQNTKIEIDYGEVEDMLPTIEEIL